MAALVGASEPSQEQGRLIYPGFGVLEVPRSSSSPMALARLALEDGRLEPGYFVWCPRDGGFGDGGLGGASAERGRPIPGGAHLLWIDEPRAWLALWRSARTGWLERYRPTHKVDPALVLDEGSTAPLRLALERIPGHPGELLIAALEALGAVVLESGAHGLVVEASARLVAPIAQLEGIYRLYEQEEGGVPSSPAHARGPDRGGSSLALSVPLTATLAVAGGRNSDDGTLNAQDLAQLRTSDDQRLNLRDRQQLTLAFEQSLPADAFVSALRVFVEHHEQPRVSAGEILWKLARGTLTSATIVRGFDAPVRNGANLETLDLWSPDALVPDLDQLVLVIENADTDDDTLLDRVYVEVDYTLLEHAPQVTSTPSLTGILGEPYAYDADGRAEASGEAPLTWTLTSGPPGFAIQPTTGLVSWTPDAAGSIAIVLGVGNAHGTETQAFVVTVLSEPPFPPTLLPANPASLGYCPLERLALGPAKTQQRLNVFLPRGEPPEGGWPVVLNNRAGGGIASLPLASLSNTGGSAPLHAFVASGVAVVDFGVTGIGGGEGLFYPPGHPSGRYESFRPADDTPEKDAVWALQWLKTQDAFALDPERVCLRGSSHGAIISMWAAMGPERARPGGSPQVRAGTRVKGVLALQPPTSVWAFLQSSVLTVRMLAHYEQAAFPGVPATAFAQVAENLQKDSSIMRFAFQAPAALANNERQALCLLYGEPVKHLGGVPADMTLDAEGYPRLHGVLAQPFVHDAWSGYVLWRRLIGLSGRAARFHDNHSVFAVRDTSALPAPLDHHTGTFTGGVTGPGARAVAHEWVLRTLAPETGPGFGRVR